MSEYPGSVQLVLGKVLFWLFNFSNSSNWCCLQTLVTLILGNLEIQTYYRNSLMSCYPFIDFCTSMLKNSLHIIIASASNIASISDSNLMFHLWLSQVMLIIKYHWGFDFVVTSQLQPWYNISYNSSELELEIITKLNSNFNFKYNHNLTWCKCYSPVLQPPNYPSNRKSSWIPTLVTASTPNFDCNFNYNF